MRAILLGARAILWGALAGLLLGLGLASAQDIKIALISSKTGPLEAYAKQTEAGFLLGLEYLTQGSMSIDGHRLVLISKDDQGKPDLAKTLLEQAYADDNAALAVGTSSSGAALAMLPVAQDQGKVLIVEPAVADQITGDKWNRFVFRTARNSTQDALAAAVALGDGEVSVATLAQDYAFGRDGVAALKEAIAATKSKAKVVFEEYAPQNATDFTASAQRIFDALKDKGGRKIIYIIWAGASPFTKIMALQPERFGISVAPGGNILPVMRTYQAYPGIEGAVYYYWEFPKNKMNDWLVAEHVKRFGAPPDFFTAGGMAAASAAVAALKKAGSTDTEKLIAAMEGMAFDTPKGEMTFRKEDHQALQVMYDFKVRKTNPNPNDILELVREIPISEMPLPIRNKR